MGHAGTLDPEATGVLPICLGRGTRIIEFLVDTNKTYQAEIELGKATDTYDGSGQVIGQAEVSGITYEEIELALSTFRGNIYQTPPMYSAVKYRGQPLYKLARKGIEIERKSRPVMVYRLEILSWQPPVATLEVECGKGTYIRSLAHDLGQSLGCGGYLKSLVRTKCGFFDIKDSTSMTQLEEAFQHSYWERFLNPVDTALQHFRAILVNDKTEDIIRKGCPVFLEQRKDSNKNESSNNKYCRVYTADGRFLGILRSTNHQDIWQPKKVFL